MSGINGGNSGSGTNINGDTTGGLTPAQEQALIDIEEKTQFQSAFAPPDTTNFDGNLTLNGIPVGGGGNPFDQDLNTTDNVGFASVSTPLINDLQSLTIDNQLVLKDGVAGNEMGLTAPASGIHTIETFQGTAPLNDLTIKSGNVRLESSINYTEQIASNSIESIGANKTIQIGANKIENISGSKQCTILGTNQLTAASHTITGNTEIQQPLNLSFATSSFGNPLLRLGGIGEIYTDANDTIIKSGGNLSFKCGSLTNISYHNLSAPSVSTGTNLIFDTQIGTFSNIQFPRNLKLRTLNPSDDIVLEDCGLDIQDNYSAKTVRTTFTDPQEFVTKDYVDNAASYELIFAVTNQISNIISTGVKFQIRAPRNFNISKIKLSLNTTAGASFSVGIRKNGTLIATILINSLVLDTAITDSFLEDDIIAVDILNVGTSTASGLICYLL